MDSEFDASQNAAIGMGRALNHAEHHDPDWGETALAFLEGFALSNETFISEDVSDASKYTCFPQPPTDRAWGAIYVRARRLGIISMDGTGRSRRRHSTICPLWRSLIYTG